MFIIKGTETVHIGTMHSKLGICPNCGAQGTIYCDIHRKHLHVFWVPLFPVGKKTICRCVNCGKTFKTKELPDSIYREYREFSTYTRGPMWQYTGLILILALVVFLYFSNEKNEKDKMALLSHPVAGDVYEIKVAPHKYSTLKVAEITRDSVKLVPNKYESRKIYKIYKIDKPENYTDSLSFILPKEELLNMYEAGKIVGIERD